MWKLNNILLNSHWVKVEINKEIRKYLKTKISKNTTYQTLWDVAKAVVRGHFIATKAYTKKEEQSQINNLTLHLKELGKEQSEPQVCRRKKVK